MYYGLIMLSVCMFGGNFVLNRQYQKESGSGLRETLLYTLLSAGAGLLILLGINGFRFEYTPFTLLIAILTAFNGIAFNVCGLRAMGSINLSLYSLFSMLGGMLLPFCAGETENPVWPAIPAGRSCPETTRILSRWMIRRKRPSPWS